MNRVELLAVVGVTLLAMSQVQAAPPPAQTQQLPAQASAMAMGDHLPTTLADWSRGGAPL